MGAGPPCRPGQIFFSRGPVRRPPRGFIWRPRPLKKEIWPAGQAGMAGRRPIPYCMAIPYIIYYIFYIFVCKIFYFSYWMAYIVFHHLSFQIAMSFSKKARIQFLNSYEWSH